MITVFPCYAAADRAFAAELADFLERGADVRVFLEDGEMEPGGDLVAKAREARMADIVVVVLSPDSVPAKWVRADWEEAFLSGPANEGVRIAFLQRGGCRFPEILRREAFFQDGRGVKRWIRNGERSGGSHPAHLEPLVAALADQPGVYESDLASDFVDHCSGDFDAVCWLRCGDRTIAQLAGELGWQLGLKLDGEPLTNALRIRRFCRDRRFLIVLEDCRTAEARELVCEGRSSTLLTKLPVRDYRPAGLAEIQQEFASVFPMDWAAACVLAKRGVLLAHEQARVAEAFELMRMLYESAKIREDNRIMKDSARELIWILEQWDRLDEADGLRGVLGVHAARQLTFDFAV